MTVPSPGQDVRRFGKWAIPITRERCGKWLEPPAHSQALEEFRANLASGRYGRVSTVCLCGTAPSVDDPIVSSIDRYGLDIEFLLCRSCGIVRPVWQLDGPSASHFYQHLYRRIYTGAIPEDVFFEDQIVRGRGLAQLLTNTCPGAAARQGIEIGCGAGGLVCAFRCAGHEVVGYDYDPAFLAYGLAKGLPLRSEDVRNRLQIGGLDLILMCHVLEHLADPLEMIGLCATALVPGGVLLLEVPGLDAMNRTYRHPLHYFQSAHTWSFARRHLEALVVSRGLQVLYADDLVRVICRRPEVMNLRGAPILACPRESEGFRRGLTARVRYHSVFRFLQAMRGVARAVRHRMIPSRVRKHKVAAKESHDHNIC
jgi:SAM-dependent methyltransferase